MPMEFDGLIDVAFGVSVRSKIWKNKKIKWTELVNKLSEPVKTNETYSEYLAHSKEEQGKIKDVGGYVGGYLRNGRRKPESNVSHRQLLTLDIDFAYLDFWDNFCIQFENAAVLHATHKHSDSTPRFRLVMPLSRECSPDEYAAIARKVAGYLNIELFDNTTFQTSRLMFWPSVSKDVEYYIQTQDGPWLNADEILASYEDWRDSRSWPTTEKRINEIKNSVDKQQDPHSKKGIIGAFCRTYGISEAIEIFLSDVYEPTDDNNRFTYKLGTTAAGLVVYDDKFAYSHHGTDPCSNKLSNVYDLVRIHKFGHLDTKEDYKGVSKSMEAMDVFAREDERVRLTIGKERLENAKSDFADGVDLDIEIKEEDYNWMKDLKVDSKGKYLSSSSNINLIFSNDKYFKDAFKENLFDGKRYIFKSMPWRKIQKSEPIKDLDVACLRNYFDYAYEISTSLKIKDGLTFAFQKKSFNPVQDYLNGLEWDGKHRVDNLLIDYFGADDNIYSKEAIRLALVGAVGRALDPGIKFDLVLTLVGPQGSFKSTFVSKLGGSWYSDTFLTVNGKEALEQLQGVWIMEMAELSGLRKAEVESIKHFISKQEDSYRKAYAEVLETHKRQCIFIGTTNKKDFLRDPSGNRRFIPIDVNVNRVRKSVVDDLTQFEIDQVWAEAVKLYKKGEKLYMSKEANLIARHEQDRHSENDERKGIIEEYLEICLPDKWKEMDIYKRKDFFSDPLSQKGTNVRQYVCIAEIWCECLGKNKQDMDRYKTREINDIMKSLEGWEQHNSTKNFAIYGKQKYYSRKLD